MARKAPNIQASFDIDNPEIQDFIDSRAYEFAGEVTSSLLQRLRDVWDEYLKTGMEEGETVYDFTDRVANIFQGQDDREEWYRARRIARTESVGAANMGSLEGYRQAGVPAKQWVSMQDDKVRDSHDEVDGQIVPIDEPFIVSGIEMDGPGDPAGGPEEICNCRCMVQPVFGEYEDEEDQVDEE